MIPVSAVEAIELRELVERLCTHMPAIASDFPAVALAYLYGSAAADAATPLSDIDIALVVSGLADDGDALDLALDVQNELIHRAGIRTADVRVINHASLILRGQVVSSGILLYSRNEASRVDFESTTRDAYLDFKPVEREVLERQFRGDAREVEMIDRQKVLRMLQLQRDYLRQLRALAQMDVDRFIADPTSTAAAKYCFLISIEACIDVGNHIISAGRLGAPTDYADVFHILGEGGVIPPEFVRTMQRMAGFRNLLIHVYSEVDDRQVYGHLSRLGDFDQFQNYVLQYLERT